MLGIEVDPESSRRLKRLTLLSSVATRTRAMAIATRRAFMLVQRHFLAYARSHHKSADALGAKHTKHMERAARNMSSASSADGGRILITMAGIGRARHDVVITPKVAKCLTIPISKMSYGKSPHEMEAKYGWGSLFVMKGRGILATSTETGVKRKKKIIPLFRLVSQVFQKRDATMLPTDAETATAARDGYAEGLRYLLKG